MQTAKKSSARIVSLVLAITLLLGVLPITGAAAYDGFIDEPLTGPQSNGWDVIIGDPYDLGSAEYPEQDGNMSPSFFDDEEFYDADDLAPSDDSGLLPQLNSDAQDSAGDNPSDMETIVPDDPIVEIPLGASGIDDGALSWYEQYQQWAMSLMTQGLKARASVSPVVSMITWGSDQVSDRVYFSNGNYINSPLPKISLNGSVAFCGEWNGQTPSGNYDPNGYGDDNVIKQILANYDNSGQTQADYAAAQILIWARIMGTSVSSWGSCPGASSANSIQNGGHDYSALRYQYQKWTGGTQNLITYNTELIPGDLRIKIVKKNQDGTSVISNATFEITGPGGFTYTGQTNKQGELLVDVEAPGEYKVTETVPPAGYKLSNPSSQTVTLSESDTVMEVEFRNEKDETLGEEEEDGYRIEVQTDVVTVTEVRNQKTIEYSDAFGQITIRKHDQDQKSLDGALFHIRVDFTDGSHLEVSNWEVDNGARLFTYWHPEGNIDAARITVTETEPPRYYEGDPSPQYADVNPTYTRTVINETWTVTITTENTSCTVVEIESGEVVATSSSSSTAEASTTPIVEHIPALIEGDRETTLTFTNQRITGDIEVIKLDANTGEPLSGAHIHLWGDDLGEARHIDLTYETGPDGIAYFKDLPPGTYLIQEDQPPFAYSLNNEIQSAVLQSGETIRKEVRNYRKPGLIIKKVDPNGKPLAGAVFELRRGSGEVLFSEVTDQNGIIFRDYLVEGQYEIEEKLAPLGYLLDDDPVKHLFIYESDDNKEYTVVFTNQRKPAIEITKVDGDDPTIVLQGAVFRITNTLTNQYWDITTGEDGKALLEDLEINTTFIIEELSPPPGYLASGYREEIVLKGSYVHTVIVSNYQKPSLKIIKKDLATDSVLEGATFRISWNNGADYRDVTTNSSGEALISDLNEGWYSILELRAPSGYLLNSVPENVLLEGGKCTEITIYDEAKPSLTISKVDSVTKTPLQYARFKIELKTDSGTTLIGEYVSDESGMIFIEDIEPGRYLITELEAPEGFHIDFETREVTIEAGQHYKLEFTNTPKGPIYIEKVDDKGNPLAGAQFKVTTMNGALVGTVTSGITGYAIIPYVEPGWYVVEEVRSAEGFILSSTPVNVQVLAGKPAQVQFVNYKKPTLEILKLDSESRQALSSAKFKVTHASGAIVGEFTSDSSGLIVIDNLDPGSYIVSEIRSPDGYILDITPQVVELEPGKTVRLEFFNVAKPGLRLVKRDKLTNQPVANARFRVVELLSGAEKDHGIFTTGDNGMFYIPDLNPGYFVVTEVQAADGYILDQTPQQVYVEGGKLNTIYFYNMPYSDLRLLKIDSETREPLESAVFKLFDEKRLEIGTYTSTALGEIYVSGLPSGVYYLQEVSAPPGYLLDTTVRQVELFGGKTTVVEIKNTPLGSLRIIKTDKTTSEPVYAVTFQIFDNSNNFLGEFTTDQNGVITLSRNMKPGKYKIKEVKGPDKYVIDSTVYTVEIREGQTTEIQIENEPKGSLLITKVDEKTKEKLSHATFLLYDSKNNVLGEYTTDNNGEILLEEQFIGGKFKIKEIKSPAGYLLDDTVRTVTIRNGETTIVEIPNEREVGNIQIVKVSNASNSITKDKEGAGLQGAVFEIYDERLNIVDKITTDKRGVATSKDLPLGKYTIIETKSPKYYFSDGEPIYAEIKVHGDLVRFKVENTPEDLEVSVTKRGIVETMAGELIRYEFSDIANSSNCSLDSFYWKDELPADAVRIQSLNTGVWSDKQTYEVWIKTNLKGWKRIQTGLNSNKEYTIDMTPSALGLASNEYVVAYKLEFGEVDAGFHSTTNPFIEVRVNNGLPGGYRFTNRTDVGGKRGSEWIYDLDSWITVIYKPNRKIPKTGY